MSSIRLGWETEGQERIQVAADAMNHHILITGTSGSGKTFAEQGIERMLAEDGGSVVVLNYNQTHQNMDREGVEWISVYEEGFPLSLTGCGTDGKDKARNRMEAAQDVIKILSGIDRLSARQRKVIRCAIDQAEIGDGCGNSEFEEICRQIQRIGEEDKRLEDAAEAVEEKYYEIFHGIKTRLREVMIPGKMVVIDLSEYDFRTQKILAELAIGILWRYARKNGIKSPFPVHLVLDECQILDFRKGSAMEEILREGRKFHLNLILATQTVSTFPPEIQPVLEIPATKLYFLMAERDRKKFAKTLPYSMEENQKLLSGLEKGTCLAVGRFEIEGSPCSGPLVLSFWDKGN